MSDERRLLDRDRILAAQDIASVDVDVPEWGGAVRIRRLKASEAQEFASLDEAHRDEALYRIVAMSVVDEQGQRLFSENDIKLLRDKAFSALMRIQKAAIELNGLAPLAIEQAKND